MQVVLYNGHKTVVVLVHSAWNVSELWMTAVLMFHYLCDIFWQEEQDVRPLIRERYQLHELLPRDWDPVNIDGPFVNWEAIPCSWLPTENS